MSLLAMGYTFMQLMLKNTIHSDESDLGKSKM